MLIPVCYSKEIIYLGDLMKDTKDRKINKYPIDEEFYAALLTKKWTGLMKKNGKLYI